MFLSFVGSWGPVGTFELRVKELFWLPDASFGSCLLIFLEGLVHLNIFQDRFMRVFMNMRPLFLALFLTFLGNSACAVDPLYSGGLDPYGNRVTAAQVIYEVLKWLKENHMAPIAIGFGALYALSVVQKENPDFFATVVRGAEWPFSIFERKVQHYFCRGKSLTWNEIASWHNRVSRVLLPLTKTTSVIDLSKDRRLRSIDLEEEQGSSQDVQWINQVKHIEREFLFLKKVLTYRLRYYKDLPSAKKKPVAISLGKVLVRTSLNRNEEIAFGLEEAIGYLDETVVYCKSVSRFSALDKEYIKRLMGSICTTCEHLGVLVDEVTAADRTKKKIPMSADGALPRGYTGTSGGYTEGYGSYGSTGSYGGY